MYYFNQRPGSLGVLHRVLAVPSSASHRRHPLNDLTRGFRDRASLCFLPLLMVTHAVGLNLTSRLVFHSPTEFHTNGSQSAVDLEQPQALQVSRYDPL